VIKAQALAAEAVAGELVAAGGAVLAALAEEAPAGPPASAAGDASVFAGAADVDEPLHPASSRVAARAAAAAIVCPWRSVMIVSDSVSGSASGDLADGNQRLGCNRGGEARLASG
jgi:hypothetical protein